MPCEKFMIPDSFSSCNGSKIPLSWKAGFESAMWMQAMSVKEDCQADMGGTNDVVSNGFGTGVTPSLAKDSFGY